MRAPRRRHGPRVPLPWRVAPRAALSSPLTLVAAAVTALLSCFLAMAAVLQASASGGAAVNHQATTVCPDAYGPVFYKPNVTPEAAATMIAAVERRAPEYGFSPPKAAMYSYVVQSEFRGELFNTRMSYSDKGLDHLRLLHGDRAPGLWMGNDLASARGFDVGIRGHIGADTSPKVTGIYADLHNPAPRWWCSQQSLAVQNRLIDTLTGSVIFATDRETYAEVVGDFPRLERLSITFDDPPPATPAEAQDRIDRSHALIAAVNEDLADADVGGPMGGTVPFERSLGIAEQAQDNVLFSILPLAAISVLVGCAGIGTVGLQWYQRRHGQLRLLSSRGAGPAALGGLAMAELGLPVLLGGGAGLLLARLLLPAYGPPGTLSTGDLWFGVLVGTLVLLVALGTLALVVAFRTHREFQLGRLHSKGRGWRLLGAVPWELVTGGLAVLGWLRLRNYGGFGEVSNPLPQVDSLALTYPVFVVLTVGLIAARIAWLLLHTSHRARFWSRPTIQLAIRRLAGARAPVTGVLVIGVLAVGTLATGTGIAAGQQQALETKAGMLVGATSRVDTEQPVGLGAEPLPERLRANSTLVGKLSGTGSVVLVVDPGTFQRVAAPGALPAEFGTLLPRLTAPRDAGGIPALRVGHTAEQTTELPGLPDARPVADVEAFPIIGTVPGYVISRDALTQGELAGVATWHVLSTRPLAALAAAMGDAGLAMPNPVSRATALDALPFYVVEWTFSYVAVLGGVLGVVAVLALLIAVEVRRRQNALAGALVLRMGLRPRALLGSHLLELGALAGFAMLTGIVCGITVAGISVPRFDPARWLAPRSELPDLAPFVLGVFGIGMLVVAAAGWIAVRSVRTARTAELLRA